MDEVNSIEQQTSIGSDSNGEENLKTESKSTLLNYFQTFFVERSVNDGLCEVMFFILQKVFHC